MFKKLVIFFGLCLLPLFALAAESPVTTLQNTSDQMISALQSNQAKIKTEPTYVYSLARQILLPHVDVQTMSRLALGRDAWQNATPSQRQQFTTEFANLMIRTYASAMASYTNQKVQFKPIRGGVGDRDRVQVESQITQQGGPSIPVSYRVVLRNGQWKVYDIAVDNVSMIQSFRSQFASEIAQGGMDGLLQAMTHHRGAS